MFGDETVHTRNHLMVPLAVDTVVVGIDAAPRRARPPSSISRRPYVDPRAFVRFRDASPTSAVSTAAASSAPCGAAAALALVGDGSAAAPSTASRRPPRSCSRTASRRSRSAKPRRCVAADGREALAVRLDADTVVAFDRRCPHLGCPVRWSAERGRFECPCHHAAFDARTGAVLFGPPTRGLTPARGVA